MSSSSDIMSYIYWYRDIIETIKIVQKNLFSDETVVIFPLGSHQKCACFPDAMQYQASDSLQGMNLCEGQMKVTHHILSCHVTLFLFFILVYSIENWRSFCAQVGCTSVSYSILTCLDVVPASTVCQCDAKSFLSRVWRQQFEDWHRP